MSFLRLFAKIIRLPFDVILLSFHWCIGSLWLFRKKIEEMFELPNDENWPFACLTEKTKSGEPACIPGRKYGNPMLFKALCPDHRTFSCNRKCESRCSMGLYGQHDAWKPSWVRLFAVGFGLLLLWSIPAYGLYLGVKKQLNADSIGDLRMKLGQTYRDFKTSILPSNDSLPIPEQKVGKKFLIAAVNLFDQGNFEEALLEFRNAVKHDPSNPNALLGLGKCLSALGRSEEAMDAFSSTIKVNPDSLDAHLQLGNYSLRIGDAKAALKHAEEATRINPKNPNTYLLQAAYFNSSGETENAEREVEKALTVNINDPSIYVFAAAYYFQHQNHFKAKECYDKALELESNFIDARLGLAMLYTAQSEYGTARSQLDQVLNTEPKNVRALTSLAELYVSERKISQAIHVYKNLRDLDKSASGLVQLRLAELLINSGKRDKGAEILEFILAEEPNNVQANLISAFMYYNLRLYHVAIDHALKALGSKGKNVNARIILAQSYMRQKNYAKAIPECKKILISLPENLDTRLSLAKAYFQLDEISEAVTVLQDAAKKHPHSPAPYFQLGNVYKKEGENELAAREFKKALAISTDFKGADNVQALLKKWAASE